MDRSDEKGYWEFILDKFRAGDRRAFELIYTEYVDALYSYGNRITHHHALVEDAIQDAFIAIYTQGGRLRKPESIEFYLYKTLRRIIIKKLKEKYRFTHPGEFAEQFDLKFPLEETATEEVEEHLALLQKELGALDSKKRELLFLKFNSGLTYNEIGAILDCKPDTVKKQVSRILSMLNTKIKKPLTGLFILFKKS